MIKNFTKAVENKNEKDLILCLDIRYTNKIDASQYHLVEKVLLGNWHSQHEEMINTIYLENLRDDRFVEPILHIALNKEVFRLYDGELESTLRKCVHALKTIDSENSRLALERLKNLNNDNVKIILEMYE